MGHGAAASSAWAAAGRAVKCLCSRIGRSLRPQVAQACPRLPEQQCRSSKGRPRPALRFVWCCCCKEEDKEEDGCCTRPLISESRSRASCQQLRRGVTGIWDGFLEAHACSTGMRGGSGKSNGTKGTLKG